MQTYNKKREKTHITNSHSQKTQTPQTSRVLLNHGANLHDIPIVTWIIVVAVVKVGKCDVTSGRSLILEMFHLNINVK